MSIARSNQVWVENQTSEFGLRVKLSKCTFMAPSVIYFGLRFSERGLQPTNEKDKATKEAPLLAT